MKVRFWGGCLLVIFSFVLLCGMVVIPSLTPNVESLPLVRDILDRLLCQPDEQILGEQSVTSPMAGRTNFSMDVSCVDSAGNVRRVQDEYMAIMVIGFIAPFLIGLFMTMAVGTRGAKQSTAPDSIGGVAAPIASNASGGEMTERLRDLKNAYDSGLITASEYEAKRREILDL